MNEILTIAQIFEQYDEEWVLITELVTHDLLGLLGGAVMFHSKDYDEVYQVALELRPKRFAIRFMGKAETEHICITPWVFTEDHLP